MDNKENSEEDGNKIYEVYGEKPIDTNNNQKIIEKPIEESILVKNIKNDEPEIEFIPNPEEIEPVVYYKDPNFDWSDSTKWINDKNARHYYTMYVKPNL